MTTRTGRLFGVSLALALVSGCVAPAGLDLLRRGQALDDAQRRYTRLMRWAEFARASEYVDPAERDAFLARTAELVDVRFTDYELRFKDVDPERRGATVRVTYRAYRLSSASETSFDEHQQWYREGSSNAWHVRSVLEEQQSSSPEPHS